MTADGEIRRQVHAPSLLTIFSASAICSDGLYTRFSIGQWP